MKNNKRGFTLVELLVVIAIIGILAVVAIPSIFSQIEKSKGADIIDNIDIIRSATSSYYSDNDTVPYETIDNASLGTKESLDGLDTLVKKGYLDGNPNIESKEKVKYIIKSYPDIKESYLDIKIKKGYMTENSINKLKKDIGIEEGINTKSLVNKNNRAFVVNEEYIKSVEILKCEGHINPGHIPATSAIYKLEVNKTNKNFNRLKIKEGNLDLGKFKDNKLNINFYKYLNSNPGALNIDAYEEGSLINAHVISISDNICTSEDHKEEEGGNDIEDTEEYITLGPIPLVTQPGNQ